MSTIVPQERCEHYNRGLEYFDQGLFADAIAEFEKVTEGSDPSDPYRRQAEFYLGEAHFQIALDLIQRESYARAEQELKEGIALKPRYPDLHYHLAKVYLAGGAVEEARAALLAALDANPDYAKALMLLGVLEYEAGNRPTGIDRISKAVELEPGYSRHVFEEASSEHRAGHWRKALALLQKLAQTDVDEIAYHFKLGKRHFRRGDYQSAIEEFETALAVRPDYADVRNWLGQALMATGDHRRALSEFQRAIEINPRFTAALINAGDCCAVLGDHAAAAGFYRRVLEIDPDLTDVRDRLRAV